MVGEAVARPKLNMAAHAGPRKLVPAMVREQNLWEIKYEGGGPVPLPLRGLYTSRRVANMAIEKFMQG